MRRVGYFHCPSCFDRRLYVLYEEPWDENMAACVECGHQFGYTVTQAIVTDPQTGAASMTSKIVPVLDADVLRAGMLELQASVHAELVRRHGGPSFAIANKQLAEGLAATDPTIRRGLLGSSAPGLQRR